MSHGVIIPKHNTRVYGSPRHGEIFVRDEVHDWLKAHCPGSYFSRSYYRTRGVGCFHDWEDYVGEHWTFKEASMAMLFKLTWGGE